MMYLKRSVLVEPDLSNLAIQCYSRGMSMLHPSCHTANGQLIMLLACNISQTPQKRSIIAGYAISHQNQAVSEQQLELLSTTHIK